MRLRKVLPALAAAAVLATTSACEGHPPPVFGMPGAGVDRPPSATQLRNGLLGRADLGSPRPDGFRKLDHTTASGEHLLLGSGDQCDRRADTPDGTTIVGFIAMWTRAERVVTESAYALTEEEAKRYMRTMRGNTCSDKDGSRSATLTDQPGIGDEALQVTVKEDGTTMHSVVVRSGGLIFLLNSMAEPGTQPPLKPLAVRAVATMHDALRTS